MQSEVAWGMGLIDTVQRRQAEAIQAQVIELVGARGLAHSLRGLRGSWCIDAVQRRQLERRSLSWWMSVG